MINYEFIEMVLLEEKIIYLESDILKLKDMVNKV